MRYAYSNFPGAVFVEVGLCPAYAMPLGQTRNCQELATHIPMVFPRLLSVFGTMLSKQRQSIGLSPGRPIWGLRCLSTLAHAVWACPCKVPINCFSGEDRHPS